MEISVWLRHKEAIQWSFMITESKEINSILSMLENKKYFLNDWDLFF